MNSLMTTRALRDSTMMQYATRSVLHAPFAHRLSFDGAKDHVLYKQTDHDDGKKTRKDVRDLELVLVFIDEPAQAARPRRDTEDELRRNQRAPRKRPADLEPGENARKRRWNENLADVGQAAQPVIP